MNKLMRLSFIVVGTMLIVPWMWAQQAPTRVPAVSLSPTSIIFAEQAVNTTSAARPVVLTNTGTATLKIASVTFTGTHAPDFAVLTNDCGESVAVGASCTINVHFTPTDVSNRNGTLTITDNAAGSPHVVQLEGSGLPAEEEAPAAPAEDPISGPTLAPDTRPLSGAEEWRVESPGRARNYAIPSLRVSAFGDSNRTISSSGTSGVEMTGSILGNLAVHRVTRRNDFSMNYTGGGLIYARNSQLNAAMHQFGIMESYKGRRWGITLGDQMAYLPESAFGFGGFGPSQGLGGNIGSTNPAFNTNQSLFSGRGARISNNALAQIEYSASSRSSITFGGSFGMLRFRDPGFVESNSAFATAGYNYAATRRDTVSIVYGFGGIRFQGSDFHVDNHFAQVSYGRRVTGRLAFEISGGPQFVILRSPALGKTTTASWSAHSSFDYSLGRTGLNWSYAHYTSSGSGLFFGAKTDNVNGSINRQLTRNWGWSVGPGYSRNARLAQGPVAAPTSAFNSIYGSTSLNRQLGRYTDFSFSYTLHEQWTNAASPTGINNGSTYLRHFFGVSVTWHAPRIAMN